MDDHPMTDPTVDALAAALRERFWAVYPDGAKFDSDAISVRAALADAGYVVVRAEDVERLDDALAAIRSLVGDHDVHPAHLPDCTICIALNGRVAPRLRAALATKETP